MTKKYNIGLIKRKKAKLKIKKKHSAVNCYSIKPQYLNGELFYIEKIVQETRNTFLRR